MRKLSPGMVVILLAGGGILVALVAYALASHYLTSSSGHVTLKNNVCNGVYRDHKVIIRNDFISPAHVSARLCDTLTIRNEDDKMRVIAFGEHVHHTAYDGITERVLRKNEEFSIQLIETGTYSFHDHLDETVAGEFFVIN